MDADHVRARVYAQWGNSEDDLEWAVKSCPVETHKLWRSRFWVCCFSLAIPQAHLLHNYHVLGLSIVKLNNSELCFDTC